MLARKALSVLLVLAMLLGLGAAASAEGMTPGTYTQTVNAMHGPLTVEVTVSADRIESVEVTDHVETPGVGDQAVKDIPERVVGAQSLAVDAVTGVTISSRAILSAVEKCLAEAGADVDALKAAPEKTPAGDVEATADVVIVGGGGAGLAAAVAATDAGASVILIEKSGFLGGNSIVAGGIYNAPDPTKQDYATNVSGDLGSLVEAAIAEEPVSDAHKALMDAVRAEYEAFRQTDKTIYDSPNWFALQTWNGGDKVAELSMVQELADNSLSSLKWLEGMGMEFTDTITHGAGSLYPRTHAAVKPNGVGYIDAFTQTLSSREGYTQMMETTGKSLIVEDGKVVGVVAEGKDGNAVTLHATKGVILATGGFAGNVELRQKYCEGEKWPDLSAKVPTSNMPAVTGDGIFMAEAAGAQLVNMEQIQLLPYCNPQTGATYDIMSGSTLGIFVNKEGTRFVREDGRRDEMAKAIIDQTDGMMYIVFSGDSAGLESKALGGLTLSYYLEHNMAGYVMADTVAELAEKLGVPADALEKTVADYNGYVEAGVADPFGRVSYGTKIATGPFFAYPRKPAVHHTMGGVRINTDAQVIDENGNVIPGLYAAGEVTGGIHGSNRLGGNALTDTVVFGRIAGASAAAAK